GYPDGCRRHPRHRFDAKRTGCLGSFHQGAQPAAQSFGPRRLFRLCRIARPEARWGGKQKMSSSAVSSVPWWKEPTKEQWLAWWAAWMGWTLDSFDFTVFLLIMVPIANEFKVPLTEVTAVFAITLWLRLVGATASGWLADRVGRKLPLMIS